MNFFPTNTLYRWNICIWAAFSLRTVCRCVFSQLSQLHIKGHPTKYHSTRILPGYGFSFQGCKVCFLSFVLQIKYEILSRNAILWNVGLYPALIWYFLIINCLIQLSQCKTICNVPVSDNTCMLDKC